MQFIVRNVKFSHLQYPMKEDFQKILEVLSHCVKKDDRQV